MPSLFQSSTANLARVVQMAPQALQRMTAVPSPGLLQISQLREAMGARRSGHWQDLAGMVFLLLASFPGAAPGAQVAPVVIVGVRPATALGFTPRRSISDAIDSGAATVADDAGLFHGATSSLSAYLT